MEHLSRRKKITILIAIMVSLLFVSLNQTIVGTALPRIVADLGGMDLFNWVFTIFMLTSSVTAILVGRLSDLYGRKPFVLAGLILFITGSFLCGTADTIIQLILYRGLQGFGGGMIMSTAFTSVGDLFPPRERGRWQGLMSASFGLASVFGPTLGGYIVDHWDWHWVFWVFLPFGLVALVLIMRLFPSATERRREKVDYLGSLFLTLTIVPMLLAFSWAGNRYEWLSYEILGLFGFTLIALAVFLWIEVRASSPVLPLDLFRNSIFTLSNIVGFLTGMGMFGTIMYTPFYVQGVQGVSATSSGFVMMPMTLSMVIASTVSGQIISRTGRYKKLGLFGLAVMAAGLFSMSRMDVDTHLYTTVINIILVGAGLGISFPIFTLTVQNAVEHSRLGVATASNQLFRQMGGTIGVSVMGTIFTHRMEIETKRLVADASPVPDAGGSANLWSAFKDPQILMDPERLERIRSALPGEAVPLFESLLKLIKESFSLAIEHVFLTGALVVLLAFILTFFLREIPLRQSNRSDERETKVEGPVPQAEG
ncbi:EmrB/QacA subfamily drug resistance transporter [Planifilum fimeticola]|jgi:EmrB/QacA subfamily drug resistance transporter|uniref:EmrB/QacA subfamily drug resistance transporter n=1 Tax=Planifilum fimeticola TaxID=201975 RepID=A0A2T0LF08_9BACL|nr:MDR family MFS transporter [Planifilum fimeticola]PRX40750.1 EmrB/QacA subfamily drug resistance transporter [Planifilum fimeticola]